MIETVRVKDRMQITDERFMSVSSIVTRRKDECKEILVVTGLLPGDGYNGCS